MEKIEGNLRSNSKIGEQYESFHTNHGPLLIGSAGCQADCTGLQRALRAEFRAASYFGKTTKREPGKAATLLSQILYLRRGFPFYSFCVLAGLDEEGRGNVFAYDAIGSYEQVSVATAGTGREALQPILDRLFRSDDGSRLQVVGSAEHAVQTLCQAYRSVAEREIGVGDRLVCCIAELSDEGSFNCRTLVFPLKEH